MPTIKINGQTFNIRDNAIGANKLKITSPNGTVINNPELEQQIKDALQRQNTRFSSSVTEIPKENKITQFLDAGKEFHNNNYHSAFDRTAAFEPIHQGFELLGKGINAVTDATGTTQAVQTIMPWLSPSQYVGWIQTGYRPGSEYNTGFGTSKDDQYLNEMFDIGTAPALMKGMGRMLKNPAVKTTIQNTVDNVQSRVVSPTLPLFDKFAAHTNVTGIIDGSGKIYKQLTPKAKYIRDRIFFPLEYHKARQAGQYPLTFAERRQYLQQLHNSVSDVRSRLIDRRVEDYIQRGELGSEWYQNNLNQELPKDVNFISREGHSYTRNNDSAGFNDGRLIDVSTRRKNSLLPEWKSDEIRGTVAHELDHSVQNNTFDFDKGILTKYTTEADKAGKTNPYHLKLNPDSPVAKDFEPITKNTGLWAGSPREVLSEMQYAYEKWKYPTQFRNLDAGARENITNFINNRFKIGDYWETYNMLDALSNKGYFSKGGIIRNNVTSV